MFGEAFWSFTMADSITCMGGAGNDILQSLKIMELGALFTSTALTLLIISAVYNQFGRWLSIKLVKS